MARFSASGSIRGDARIFVKLRSPIKGKVKGKNTSPGKKVFGVCLAIATASVKSGTNLCYSQITYHMLKNFRDWDGTRSRRSINPPLSFSWIYTDLTTASGLRFFIDIEP